MPELVFATSNQNKVEEVQKILGTDYRVLSLRDIGFEEEIPEPYDTFSQNAYTKAQTIYDRFGKPCFAEDSGLVVPALDGAPGVLSARYAGDDVDHDANIELLLQNLKPGMQRKAYFIAIICYLDGSEPQYFEGRCLGTIATERHGNHGFGYDPVFCPEGFNRTFAELGMDVKKRLSHRAKAVKEFIKFLRD